MARETLSAHQQPRFVRIVYAPSLHVGSASPVRPRGAQREAELGAGEKAPPRGGAARRGAAAAVRVNVSLGARYGDPQGVATSVPIGNIITSCHKQNLEMRERRL